MEPITTNSVNPLHVVYKEALEGIGIFHCKVVPLRLATFDT